MNCHGYLLLGFITGSLARLVWGLARGEFR